jgi:CBS-domain-containing membrane protein
MANKMVCLPVRSVRVVSACGLPCEDAHVSCPMRGATTLPMCESCERLEMITADEEGEPDAVMCRPPVPLWARLLERVRGLPKAPVHTLITRGLTCATCDATPRQLADIMAEGGVDAVPIVDYERCVIGIVSRGDLVADAGVTLPMIRRAVTLEQSETIARAVELMLIEGAHHLVVTDEREHVVGLLSAREVARHMVRSLERSVGRAA